MNEYRVWCPDHGGTIDDAEVIETYSAEAAAIKWGRDHDIRSADYYLAGGGTQVVCVALYGQESFEQFELSAEPDVHYMARPINGA